MVKVKVMKNGLGEYGIWWGIDDKCTKLAYKRFFKDKVKADTWAKRFENKLLKK